MLAMLPRGLTIQTSIVRWLEHMHFCAELFMHLDGMKDGGEVPPVSAASALTGHTETAMH